MSKINPINKTKNRKILSNHINVFVRRCLFQDSNSKKKSFKVSSFCGYMFLHSKLDLKEWIKHDTLILKVHLFQLIFNFSFSYLVFQGGGGINILYYTITILVFSFGPNQTLGLGFFRSWSRYCRPNLKRWSGRPTM
jgi:hypothetical protein